MLSFLKNRNPDERARELLSSYLDGRCTPAEKAFVESRLAESPTLRAELAELRATVDALRRMPQVPLPRSFYLNEAMLAERKAKPILNRVAPLLLGLRMASGAVALSLLSVLLLAVLAQNAAAPQATVLQPATAPAPGFAQKSGTAGGIQETGTPMILQAQAAVTATATPARSVSALSATAPQTATQTGAPAASQAPPQPTLAKEGVAAATTVPSNENQPGIQSAVPTPAATASAYSNAAGSTQSAPSAATVVPAGAAPQPSVAAQAQDSSGANQEQSGQRNAQGSSSPPAVFTGGGLWSVAGILAVLLVVLLAAQTIVARRS